MSKKVLIDNERSVFYFVIVSSILLSIWVALRTSIINPDGICYLQSAEAFKSSGLSAAMQACAQAKWPFYATLISLTSLWLHLDNMQAAYLVNGLFSVISVLTFILIIKELGGTKKTLWFAAIVILTAHRFSNLRDSIIRDHGYWAFYLLSLFFLLRFYRTPQWKFAVGFSVSLIMATLFRIEGIFFLIGIPLTTLFYQQYAFKKRLRLFLLLNMVILIVLCIGTILFFSKPEWHLNQFGRLPELGEEFHRGLTLMTTRLTSLKQTLATTVLPKEANDTHIVLSVLLISWYLSNLAFNLSLIYSVLFIYGWVNKVISKEGNINSRLNILLSYGLINLCITSIFFIQNLFLSSRYLIAFSLLLMLWVPFALEDIMVKSRTSLRYRGYACVAMIGIMISFVGVMMVFGGKKSFIRQAGSWLAVNIPKEASLFSNNQRLMFYSKHFNHNIFETYQQYKDMNLLENEKWRQFDYVALKLSHHKPGWIATSQALGLTPVQIFMNRQGDRVVIYKTTGTAKN